MISFIFVMSTHEEFVGAYWSMVHMLSSIDLHGRKEYIYPIGGISARPDSTYILLPSQLDIITCLTFIFLVFRCWALEGQRSGVCLWSCPQQVECLACSQRLVTTRQNSISSLHPEQSLRKYLYIECMTLIYLTKTLLLSSADEMVSYDMYIEEKR